jgi:hypothetical protein
MMVRQFPGTPEAGLLGFAFADALADVLVAKGILTPDDIEGILRTVADRLQQSNKHVPVKAASFIRDSMLSALNK